jgi:serine phosphatase RsbU (regulator of sigma subunit)
MSEPNVPEIEALLAENALLREECARLATLSDSNARMARRALASYQNRALQMELIRQKNDQLAELNRELAKSLAQLKSTQDQLVEAARSAALAEKEKLEKEMAIASRIQTSILPRQFEVDGLQIAARMIPATEVGGDYYDVLPVEGGCWLAIGDVAGHGLTAGLVMLMIQSVVSGLARQNPEARPSDMLSVLNAVLFDNIRLRLHQREHATLSLLRYDTSGHIVFAGAHEEIVIYRASEGRCECIETPGPWLGAMANVQRFAVNTPGQLYKDDVMLLYTDGITEAMNEGGKQYGMERMCTALEEVRSAPVEEIRDHVIESVMKWTSTQVDDVTLVVARHLGVGAELKREHPRAANGEVAAPAGEA